MLITDHNVRETLDVCERAYIVSQGKLIAHGTPDAILADEQVKRVYLGEEFRLLSVARFCGATPLTEVDRRL